MVSVAISMDIATKVHLQNCDNMRMHEHYCNTYFYVKSFFANLENNAVAGISIYNVTAQNMTSVVNFRKE